MHFIVKRVEQANRSLNFLLGIMYLLLTALLLVAAAYLQAKHPDSYYLAPTALAILTVILAGRRFMRM